MDAGYGVARVFAELEARRIEASFQHGASHPRKKGLCPRVGSNWMGGTMVSALSARPASGAAQQTKCGGLQSLSFKHSRLPSMSTASGLFQPKTLGLSVNESSMPPIAHVSRAFTEKRKLGMKPNSLGASAFDQCHASHNVCDGRT
jgi:hypothetical protein